MSLEDAVNRLANAVAMKDDVAVKEIIRQRDAALRDAEHWKTMHRYENERADLHCNTVTKLNWKVRTLLGVITKLKRKRADG